MGQLGSFWASLTPFWPKEVRSFGVPLPVNQTDQPNRSYTAPVMVFHAEHATVFAAESG